MKTYFAKYLPVEGEIKEDDYYIAYNEIFKADNKFTSNNSNNPNGLGYMKVKLFLCSRDIDLPCPKCGSDNTHGNYDYTKKNRPLIDTLCNECGEIYPPYKVIGEILTSGIVENQEFTEKEVEFLTIGESIS